jgi:hypothetical protein
MKESTKKILPWLAAPILVGIVVASSLLFSSHGYGPSSSPSSSRKVGDYYPPAATNLNLSGQAQGDIAYFNGTSWVVLAPGTSGNLLKTNGASANPSWASVSGGATYAAYGSRPAAGTAGRLYYPSDGFVPYIDDGAAWRPLVDGAIGKEPAPGNSLAAYTVAGVLSVTNVVGGSISISQPSDGGSNLVRGYTIPKTAGKKLIVGLTVDGTTPSVQGASSGGNMSVGITVGDTADGTGKLYLLGLGYNGIRNDAYISFNLDFFTNKTTYSSSPFSLDLLPRPGRIWLELCEGSTPAIIDACYSLTGPLGQFVCFNDDPCGSAAGISSSLTTNSGGGSFYGIGVRSTVGSAAETILSIGQY